MDRMRVNRVSRVGRVAMAAGDAAHTILTITNDGGGNAVVATAAPHGLSNGANVVIAGTSSVFYVGEFDAITVLTPTTFDIGAVYIEDSTGGTWRLA